MRKLVQRQILPITLDEAWAFFATPKNLNEVTPDDMTFEFTSELPEKMYEGMFISYRIRPFLNIPMNWITEITHIKEKDFFVDEQRVGPYKIWHHEHHFEAVENGVLMTDILHYDIGMSFLGWIAGVLFVHRKVKNIFEFRHKELKRIFE
ncbi:MAG TPA: SRPBCC family protein [Prolixibacteraceae bacterium]|nr:SRPBCC family protein [Prolixibacteraceae bacterium]